MPLPITTLLSQALVAYTIEFDNEAEHRMAHRTTRYNEPGQRGVWLGSRAMWLNCMQYLSDEPMLVSDLEQQARTGTNLDGMRRWGYVVLESPSGADPKRKPKDLTIRATRRGREAQPVWRALTHEIEETRRGRFGRAALAAVAAQVTVELPDSMPILQYALFSARREWVPRTPGDGPPDAELTLPVLLARVLLSITHRFEPRSPLSLAVCADLLRVLDTDGVLVKDLPVLTGVSKEALAMAMHPLTKRDLAVAGRPPGGGRFKAVRLTDRGQEAQWRYLDFTERLDDAAGQRLGAGAVAALRATLEPPAGDPDEPAPSPLKGGAEAY